MKFAVLFAAAGMTAFLAACGPELAQTPYTQEETEWKNYLEQQYPGWRAPQTPPPKAVSDAPAVSAPSVAEEETLVISEPEKKEFELVNETVYNDGSAVYSDTAAVEAVAPKYVEYTVKKGDTLGGIARQFYQKSTGWKQIYKANTNVISDPNKLKIGTVLRIPQP